MAIPYSVDLNGALNTDDMQSLLSSLDSQEDDEVYTFEDSDLDDSEDDEVDVNRALSKDEIEFLISSIAFQKNDGGFNFEKPDLDDSEDDEVDKRAKSYVGLSINAIMKHIFKCARQHKRNAKAVLYKDIFEMVVIGVKRGNIRKDQLARTAPRGAARINQLAYLYEISMRSSARQRIRLQKDTLTFVRAITCFPHMASHLLYRKVGFARNGVNSVLASEQLPDAMKHSGFSGLIPKSCDPYLMKAYLYAHAAYMVDFSKLINPNDKRSLKAMGTTQLKFSKVDVENAKSPYSDKFRVGILKSVGLTDPAVFNKIVDVCNNLCKVVGEPELTLEDAEKYHIKNNMICFFEDDRKDVAVGDQTETLADKLRVSSINDASTSKN